MPKRAVKGKRDYKREVDRKRSLKERKKIEEKKRGEEKIDEKRVYTENIYKTFISSIFGIIGAFMTFHFNFSNFIGIFLILILIPVERYVVFSRITKNFKGRDWFYVSLMTFFAWYIFLMILLNL